MHDRSWLLLSVAIVGTACGAEPTRRPVVAAQQPPPADITIVDGQTVYVPVYSHVYFKDPETPYYLGVTLSIRNTDPEHEITLTGVTYFDTEGTALESYVTQPKVLDPMASMSFVVGETDERGGDGANFIVTWTADGPVYEPVVEAAMVGGAGGQGVSFISHGRVYQPRR